jgi:hypothetical protein
LSWNGASLVGVTGCQIGGSPQLQVYRQSGDLFATKSPNEETSWQLSGCNYDDSNVPTECEAQKLAEAAPGACPLVKTPEPAAAECPDSDRQKCCGSLHADGAEAFRSILLVCSEAKKKCAATTPNVPDFSGRTRFVLPCDNEEDACNTNTCGQSESCQKYSVCMFPPRPSTPEQ